MKRKTQLKIMQHVCMLCAVFTGMAGVLGVLELTNLGPKYGLMPTLFACLFFITMSVAFLKGMSECRTKLRKSNVVDKFVKENKELKPFIDSAKEELTDVQMTQLIEYLKK